MRVLDRLDDDTLWRGAVATTVVSVAMAVVGLAVAVAGAPATALTASWILQNTFATLILAPMFLLTARAQPRNRVVWVVGVATLLSGTQGISGAAALLWIIGETGSYGTSGFEVVPAELSLPAALANWYQNWSWVPIIVASGPLLLLWFPDGRLPSRRWRPVELLAHAAMVLLVAGHWMVVWPGATVPAGEAMTKPPASVLLGIGFPLLGLSTVAAFASVVVRARSAEGVVRRQIRTLGYGATIFGATAAVSLTVDSSSRLFQITSVPAIAVLAAAFALAIGRHRLFDIDVVINRTVVFAVLAVFITGIYAAIVVGVGGWLGDPSNPLLAITATALVAVIFEPVRARVQHWANVVAYGRRATPYEALATFTDHLDTTAVDPDQQLGELTRLLADATGTHRATVWLADHDGHLHPAAVAPTDADPPPPATSVDDLPADAVSPVTLDGDLLGAVGIDARRGTDITTLDRRVLDELAGQAALVLGNARLRARLRDRLAALTASRRRLVTATDEARRRLERDLHDGAQQHLVAVKVKLGLARTLATREHADTTADTLDRVAGHADAAVDALRDLARGIYPPLLETDGLPAALDALARKTPTPVTVHTHDTERHPRPIEAAIYFCCTEALRHTDPHTPVDITLTDTDHTLTFTVTGLPHHTTTTDLQPITDRLDTINATLTVHDGSGDGVKIVGEVPAQAVAAAQAASSASGANSDLGMNAAAPAATARSS